MNNKIAFIISVLGLSVMMGCGKQAPESLSASEQLLKAKESLDFPTKIENFDCIGDFKEKVGMLGRGENYPDFLILDMKQELVRQDPRTKLVKAVCTGEVALSVSFVDVSVDGENTQALDKLSASFPMDIWVDFDAEQWSMNVEHEYLVENMATSEQPKVTQNFKVLNTYDVDGDLIEQLINSSDR